jgi:hypothetical protein
VAAMSSYSSPKPLTATPDPRAAPRTYGHPGMVGIFVAVMLFMTGGFNVLFGIAALLNDEVVAVGGTGVAIWDFTAWGWIMIVAGVVMMLTALGLALGLNAARWPAVGFVMLNALAQFGIVSAFPWLAVLLIGIDVVVLYQLTARWNAY